MKHNWLEVWNLERTLCVVCTFEHALKQSESRRRALAQCYIGTWDGSSGWSRNSKNESTKASSNIAAVFAMVLWTSSICKGTSSRTFLSGCSINHIFTTCSKSGESKNNINKMCAMEGIYMFTLKARKSGRL